MAASTAASPGSTGGMYGRSWSRKERTCRKASRPHPNLRSSSCCIEPGSPMSPLCTAWGTLLSLRRRAVASSDLALKSTPTIVRGQSRNCRPREVWSRTCAYSVRSSRPSPQPMSTTNRGCSASGRASNVAARWTPAMSEK
eukprot:scaffold30374_cov107-Isochrysis_galbana.AAC.7